MTSTLPTSQTITKTISALAANGMTAEVVSTAADAKAAVLAHIPAGAEVMTMTSITLEQTGLAEALNTKPYVSVKQKLNDMSRETESQRMQELGAAPSWAVGSVHGITEDGQVVVTSNTGSQLPAYVYGAEHVVWVVSTKKVVPTIDAALARIKEEVVPKESARARKAYGLPDTWHTNMSKTLIVNREITPNRIHVVFVNEDLGF